MASKVRCPNCNQRVKTKGLDEGQAFVCDICQTRLIFSQGKALESYTNSAASAPDDVCHSCNQRGIPGSPEGLLASNFMCRYCGAPVPDWMREEALGHKATPKKKSASKKGGASSQTKKPAPPPAKLTPQTIMLDRVALNTVHCPKCRSIIEAEGMIAGQWFTCPYCNAGVKVPGQPKSAAKRSDSKQEKKEFVAIAERNVSEQLERAAAQLALPHLAVEIHSAPAQRRLLRKLYEAFAQGIRDPELLYMGGRYAAALGLRQEARRFLDPLAKMLAEGEHYAPAYFPVGLLYLQVLPADDPERAKVLKELEHLATLSPQLSDALTLSGYASAPSDEASKPELQYYDEGSLQLFYIRPVASTPEQLLARIRQDYYGIKREVLSLVETNGRASGDDANTILRIQQLGQQAQRDYQENHLAQARAALENILLLDGDQPDALRNLITVTGEQQDVEAYERYWRRYVKALLWRVMRGDDARVAIEDLVRFYSKVAKATDREFSETSAKTSERLKTPGLLARWLEAHAALVWLEASMQPSPGELSSHAAATNRAAGRFDYVPLMKFWYQVYYPEFYAYLDLSAHSSASHAEPIARLARASLPFDPAQRILARFADWYQFGFYMGKAPTYDAYAEALVALVGFVARMPMQPYLLDLIKKFELDEVERLPLRRALQEACSRPLFLKRDRLRDAEDWAGIVEFLGDEVIRQRLNPINCLWLAYALCKVERQAEGLTIACQALPDMLKEEFEKDTYTESLFQAVINLNLAKVLPKEGSVDEKGFRQLVNTLNAVPEVEAAPEFIPSVVEMLKRVEENSLIDEALKKAKELVAENRFAEAKAVLHKMPETSEEARDIKRDWLNQIEEIEERERNNALIDQLLEQAKAFVADGKFTDAKAAVRRLPGKSAEMQELRQSWLSEIEKIEERERVNQQIDKILAQAKKLVELKRYSEAKKEVRRLPTSSEELRALRDDWLKQIEEVEQRDKLDAQIDTTIARAKELIAQGNIAGARAAVKRLPDNDYTRELRNNLLSQIDDVERQDKEAARLKTLIDSTFESVQRYINLGKYTEARNAVKRLPDTPDEVRKIKDKWLADINKIAGPDLDDLLSFGRSAGRTANTSRSASNRLPYACRYCGYNNVAYAPTCLNCRRSGWFSAR